MQMVSIPGKLQTWYVQINLVPFKSMFFVLSIIMCVYFFLSWQFMAYNYYLKAAQRGNIRGATILADIWTISIPGYLLRRPEDAVLWAAIPFDSFSSQRPQCPSNFVSFICRWVKWAGEHNGYLGSILRTALDSFLSHDMWLFFLFVCFKLDYIALNFFLSSLF